MEENGTRCKAYELRDGKTLEMYTGRDINADQDEYLSDLEELTRVNSLFNCTFWYDHDQENIARWWATFHRRKRKAEAQSYFDESG